MVLHAASARGATPNQGSSAPHSSASKWMKEIHRRGARVDEAGDRSFAELLGRARLVDGRPFRQSGLPHTAYVVRSGETVPCAATRDQRFSVVHLKAGFTGAERVDVHVRSPHIGEILVEDVPVDWDGGEVAVLQAGATVRALPTTTLVFELRGKRSGADAVFGTYVLEHRALPE